MLNHFKGALCPAEISTGRPSARADQVAAGSTLAAEPPLSLPEVKEGNLESDWALWEDSVAFQDSQLPSPGERLDCVRAYSEHTYSEHSSDLDPFAGVHRRSA